MPSRAAQRSAQARSIRCCPMSMAEVPRAMGAPRRVLPGREPSREPPSRRASTGHPGCRTSAVLYWLEHRRRETVTDPLAVEGHFAFGESWKSFVNVVNANRIARAEAGMRRLFPDGDLRGVRFLDVGCGSGLSSLAAARSGAAQVHGVDIDPASVEAARSLLGRHLPPGAWSARIASVFDLDPARDGLFDVVYSWGVLHHTGAMWRAVESAAALVRPGGLLAVALYRKTALCEFWRREKALYARAPAAVQAGPPALYKAPFVAVVAAPPRNPPPVIPAPRGRG